MLLCCGRAYEPGSNLPLYLSLCLIYLYPLAEIEDCL